MPAESEHHTSDQSLDEKSGQLSGQVSSDGELDPGRHMLGPHVVGQRVVVRRLLPGQTGPTGGPAFTDVLGTCLAWNLEARECTVQRADGGTVTIGFDLVVSGKPVPPRPSVRLRVDAAEAEAQVADLWAATVTSPAAGWTLRSTPATPPDRPRKRGNSLLAVTGAEGSSSPAEASAAARAYYADLGQDPLAATVPGSADEAALLGLGWSPLGEGDSAMLLAPVSRATRRAAGHRTRHTVHSTEEETAVRSHVQDAQGQVLARGRAVLTGADWVGVEDLWVAPEHRRTGLAHAVLADLLDWAASRGALTAWLHVELANTGALALYEALGFTEHHRMTYLRG